MWVSRSEFEALKNRVGNLELMRLPQREPREPEKMKYYPDSFYATPPREVFLQDVIHSILRHLGLRLEYDDGIKPHTKLIPMPKPKKAKA